MDKQEIRRTILENLRKKLKTKTKFYLKDIVKMVPDEKPREVRKIVFELVTDRLLEYWSSGSTTMIGLKGVGKQANAENED